MISHLRRLAWCFFFKFTWIYNQMVRVRCVLIRSILNWIDALKKKKINYEIGIIKILTSSLKLNKKEQQRVKQSIAFVFSRNMITCMYLHACIVFFILFYFSFFDFVWFSAFVPFFTVPFRTVLGCSSFFFFSIQFLFNLFCCFFLLIVNLVCFFDPVTLFSCTRIWFGAISTWLYDR